jgi:hypothetical protein
MWRWLVREWQWPAATLFAGLFLLAILPVFAAATGIAVALVFVQLPIYMLHQWEEHAGDRFRLYVNRIIGGGRPVLTPGATFWINSLGVWAVNLVAVYLAWLIAPSAGVVAGYLSLINAAAHIVQAIARREYNPGLVTAIILFLPAGGWCVWEVGSSVGAHALGLGAALAVHAVIITYVVWRVKLLSRTAAPGAETGQAALSATQGS